MATSWVAQAREQRLAGKKLSEIAAAVGRDPATVYRQIADIPFVRLARVGVESAIEIPSWVRRADLVQDFRDVARERDEFAAASHCRALLREMRAGA